MVIREEGSPRVFTVTPIGPVSDDPADSQAVRSLHHMRITSEVPRHAWLPAHREYLSTVTESRSGAAPGSRTG